MTPPPPQTRRHAPPTPPRKRRNGPPRPPKSDDMQRFAREDSFVAPFVAGDFASVPADVLPVLYEYCRHMDKGKLIADKVVSQVDVKGAVFCYTDFPFCTWHEALVQLRNKILFRTPFSTISTRCLEWLRKECEFEAARDAAKGV